MKKATRPDGIKVHIPKNGLNQLSYHLIKKKVTEATLVIIEKLNCVNLVVRCMDIYVLNSS